MGLPSPTISARYALESGREMWRSPFDMSENEFLAPVPKPKKTKCLPRCLRFFGLWFWKERRVAIFYSLAISVYLVIGAHVFQMLESPFEEQVRLEHQQLFSHLSNKTSCSNLSEVLTIANKVLRASKYGIVELPGNENSRKWDSWGSLFFAASVVSTIGYGNVVPATLAGQKFCIVYALLGVPLCLGFVCSVGQWFTKLSDHIRDHSIRQKSLKFLATPGLVLFFFITHLVLPAISFSIYEDWSFHESVYFCFITLSTVGFGDYVAGEKPNHRPLYKIILIVWTFYGMALLTSIVTHVGRAVVSATKLNSTDEKKESTDAACQTEAELW